MSTQKPCLFCDQQGGNQAEPADCRMNFELVRPSGKVERKSYAICESCGSMAMEHLDIEERQIGMVNLAN